MLTQLGSHSFVDPSGEDLGNGLGAFSHILDDVRLDVDVETCPALASRLMVGHAVCPACQQKA